MGWVKPSVPNLKILVLGEYGKGKSYFASTCPEPIFLLDFDRGSLGYSSRKAFVPDFLQDQSLRASQKLAQTEQVLDALVRGGGEIELDGEKVRFRTVVLDSLTTLVKLAMDKAMELRPVSPDSPPVWNVHYPMAKVFVDRLFDRLVRIPAIIVALAHIDYLRDELTGEIRALPSVTGNLRTYIPALFDEVWFADTVQEKGGLRYVLRLVPSGFKNARSRLRSVVSLPEVIPNDWRVVEQALVNAGYKIQ